MKALVIHRYGDNSIAGIEDVPSRSPSAEVLVKVRAASINPLTGRSAREGEDLHRPHVPKSWASNAPERSSRPATARPGSGRRPGGAVRRVRRLGPSRNTPARRGYRLSITGAVPSIRLPACPSRLTALQSLRDHGRIEAGMQCS